MTRSIFYCPYCQISYEIESGSGFTPKCSLCGDLLSKKSFLNPTRIIATILASIFVIPLIVFVLSIFQNPDINHEDKYLSALSPKFTYSTLIHLVGKSNKI